jgi:hypothetical protein
MSKPDIARADFADSYDHEVRIQKAYAARLADLREGEVLIESSRRFDCCDLIADMATVDKTNTIRIWEFKIRADYKSLGQIITYLALARYEEVIRCWRPLHPPKRLVGVLAAFDFQQEIVLANVVMNCGIEFVTIPPFLRNAGDVPVSMPRPHAPVIPPLP